MIWNTLIVWSIIPLQNMFYSTSACETLQIPEVMRSQLDTKQAGGNLLEFDYSPPVFGL
jgi:hypothetical protein